MGMSRPMKWPANANVCSVTFGSNLCGNLRARARTKMISIANTVRSPLWILAALGRDPPPTRRIRKRGDIDLVAARFVRDVSKKRSSGENRPPDSLKTKRDYLVRSELTTSGKGHFSTLWPGDGHFLWRFVERLQTRLIRSLNLNILPATTSPVEAHPYRGVRAGLAKCLS